MPDQNSSKANERIYKLVATGQKLYRYSRLPAFPDNVCNSRIHVLWYVKTSVLKSHSTNNLHRVHSSPWLLQSTQLPQYDAKAIYITSAAPSLIVQHQHHIPGRNTQNLFSKMSPNISWNFSKPFVQTYFSLEGSFLSTSGAIHSA